MSRRHTAQSVTRRHAELAWAAPQVIAHRTARMLAAGATPSARDSAEFSRMVSEKTAAFSQAWMASWMAMAWAPWRIGMDLMRVGGGRGSQDLLRAWQRQAWGIAGAGLAPVHRTATANARRLGRR